MIDWRPISELDDGVQYAAFLDAKNRLVSFGSKPENAYWRWRPMWLRIGLWCRVIKPSATHFVALPDPMEPKG